jgi:membrane protease YdiL (CAAX protease family)
LLLFTIVYGLVVLAPLKLLGAYPISKPLPNDLVSILKIVIMVPLLEETMFRMSLRSSKYGLSLALAALLFMVANMFGGFFIATLLAASVMVAYAFFTPKERLMASHESFLQNHFCKIILLNFITVK